MESDFLSYGDVCMIESLFLEQGGILCQGSGRICGRILYPS